MNDASRRRSRVTRAFVDRAPIHWGAVLSRVGNGPDRRFYETLRLLDSIRQATDVPLVEDRSLAFRLAVVLVALAGIQTAVSLTIVAVGYVLGEAPTAGVPQLILACAFAAAGILLGSATPKDRRILFLLTWFVLAASAFARYALRGLPVPSVQAIDIVVLRVVPEAFMPACFWEFILNFPRVQRFTAFDRFARQAATFAWLLGGLLFVLNLLHSFYSITESPLEYALREHPSGLFWRLFVAGLVPAMAALLVRTRHAPLLERQRVSRFVAAIAVGTTPFFIFGVVRASWPGVNEWFLTATAAERVWIDAVILVALAATPLLTTATIIADKPFTLHAMLSPASVYRLARGLVTAGTLFPFAALALFLYEGRRHSIVDLLSGPLGLPLVICAAAAWLLLATRARLLGAMDRYVSRRASDPHQQLARALDHVRLARGVRELARVLERELRSGTGSTAVALLIPDRSGVFVDEFQALAPLPADSSLVAILTDTDEPIDVSADSELRQRLPTLDHQWVAANDVALLSPLKHRDDALAAVLLLGPKRGDLPFDERDLWLMTTLTTAAAATWDEADGRDRRRVGRLADGRGDRQSGEPAFECPRCGVVGEPSARQCACGVALRLAAVPERLGNHFVVQRRLGAGGMGVVYLARDTALGRDVALKTLPHLAAGAVARLRDEAHAMATLNHESLAVIYGLEEWRRTPVLIVEYLPNGTLADRLTQGQLSPAETIALGIALARALVYMHARGVLHRDLKPSNIGFTAAGTPKLLDFGLAGLGHAVRAGTRAYLPPEALTGASASATFDLWALTQVLREAVTAPVPPALNAFFDRTLDRDPERRPRTAADLLAALKALHSATS